MSDQQALESVPFRPFQRAKRQIPALVGERHVDFGRNAVEPCSSLLLVIELHAMAVGLRRSPMAPIHFSSFWRDFLFHPGSLINEHTLCPAYVPPTQIGQPGAYYPPRLPSFIASPLLIPPSLTPTSPPAESPDRHFRTSRWPTFSGSPASPASLASQGGGPGSTTTRSSSTDCTGPRSSPPGPFAKSRGWQECRLASCITDKLFSVITLDNAAVTAPCPPTPRRSTASAR